MTGIRITTFELLVIIFWLFRGGGLEVGLLNKSRKGQLWEQIQVFYYVGFANTIPPVPFLLKFAAA